MNAASRLIPRKYGSEDGLIGYIKKASHKTNGNGVYFFTTLLSGAALLFFALTSPELAFNLSFVPYSVAFAVSYALASLFAVLAIASELRARSPKTKISVSSGNCKITVSGEAMRGTPGVSARVFKAVSSVDADVRMVTTSEIEIAMLIVKSDVDDVIEAINKEFE